MSTGRHAPREDDDAPAGDPDDRRLTRYAGRPLLFVFWTLVVWGTVYAAVFLFAVLADGPRAAVARATAGPDGAVGVANLAVAVLAVGTWSVVGALLLRRRGD